MVLNEASNWSGVFEHLDKYDATGKEILYTVIEDKIDNYTTRITGNREHGFVITNTNTEKVQVNGEKTWEYDNNRAGKRPREITVNLLADGKKIKELRVSEDNFGKWRYHFSDLPKYKSGREIRYTVTENPIAEYYAEINGYHIINHYKKQKTVSIDKSKKENKVSHREKEGTATINNLKKAEQSSVSPEYIIVYGWHGS